MLPPLIKFSTIRRVLYTAWLQLKPFLNPNWFSAGKNNSRKRFLVSISFLPRVILKFSLIISLVYNKDTDIEAPVPASVTHHCLVLSVSLSVRLSVRLTLDSNSRTESHINFRFGRNVCYFEVNRSKVKVIRPQLVILTVATLYLALCELSTLFQYRRDISYFNCCWSTLDVPRECRMLCFNVWDGASHVWFGRSEHWVLLSNIRPEWRKWAREELAVCIMDVAKKAVQGWRWIPRDRVRSKLLSFRVLDAFCIENAIEYTISRLKTLFFGTGPFQTLPSLASYTWKVKMKQY